MIIHVYTHVYNEELMLPYFLRYYTSFADRIFVYDANSTDGTRDIVRACPKAELRDFDCDDIDERKYLNLANTFYTGSRGVADWVIIPDADEFVYHPDVQGVLTSQRDCGVRLIKPDGYNMVSHTTPTTQGQIYEEIHRGVPEPIYSKPIVFDPILDINLGWGKHGASPSPPVQQVCTSGLKLLHYIYLGEDMLRKRFKIKMERLSQTNKDLGLGLLYYQSEAKMLDDYRNLQASAQEVL